MIVEDVLPRDFELPVIILDSESDKVDIEDWYGQMAEWFKAAVY